MYDQYDQICNIHPNIAQIYAKGYRSIEESDNVDDDNDETVIVVAEEVFGEFLQTGHVAFILSHSSMQSAWK